MGNRFSLSEIESARERRKKKEESDQLEWGKKLREGQQKQKEFEKIRKKEDLKNEKDRKLESKKASDEIYNKLRLMGAKDEIKKLEREAHNFKLNGKEHLRKKRLDKISKIKKEFKI